MEKCTLLQARIFKFVDNYEFIIQESILPKNKRATFLFRAVLSTIVLVSLSCLILPYM